MSRLKGSSAATSSTRRHPRLPVRWPNWDTGATDMSRARAALACASAASALLVGCAVGPEYERPKLPAPPQYRFDAATQAQSLADLPWWEVFDDSALQALLWDAVANNLDLRTAVARVEE